MPTATDLCNLAVAKLGGSQITTIEPPKTPNERLLALLYPQCRDSELRAYAWNFARKYAALSPTTGAGSDVLPYVYELPPDCMRPIRGKADDWEVNGRTLWSSTPDGITLIYISRPVDTAVFDPLFNDVMIARLAYEACESITQSNEKKKDAQGAYEAAISRASKANAFERFPDDIQSSDSAFSWVSAQQLNGANDEGW